MGKKRKSGNGTSARQWVYIVANLTLSGLVVTLLIAAPAYLLLPAMPWPWLVAVFLLCLKVKVGITSDLSARMKGIKSTSPGPDIRVFAARINLAYQVEQFIHRLFKPFNQKWYGTGKTEWFWGPVGVPAAAIVLMVWISQSIIRLSLVLALAIIILRYG